jgi:tetratricopeptide (TPR) repeat protein
MSDSPHNATTAESATPKRPLPVRAVTGALHWATASKLNMGLAAGTGLLILAGVFAAWSYIAHLAIDSLQPVTIEMALEALDSGRPEEAKAIIGDMQGQIATPKLIGGAMFVLGAIKAREADAESSDERRSATYQLASRYLSKARAQMPPKGREADAAYLLGKSLVRSGHAEAGIAPLNDALALGAQPAGEIHALLVRALLESPQPDLPQALIHNQHVIDDAALPGEFHQEAWLQRAETLVRLGRGDEAAIALAKIGEGGEFGGRRTLLAGRLEMEEAMQLDQDSPDRAIKLEEALAKFEEAQRLDLGQGELARQAMYLTARCYDLRGDIAGARAQFDRLWKLHGDTDEGLAAALAEADYARADGEREQALAGYRAVLKAVGNPRTYDNRILPLEELRARLWTAYQEFLAEGEFASSLAMLDLFEPVLGPAQCTELRAKTEQQWGAHCRSEAALREAKGAEKLVKEGRFHLRASGRAYEDLARMRYATRFFTRDLWDAADCYFQGQSYTNAERLFAEYLLHDARQRNDVALVRLGQARLAMSNYDEAIAALEECIEIYSDSVVTHQARLEAARAYRQLEKPGEAERLLRNNLEAPALTPASPEWRDSLFELGQLLYEEERFQESVDALQEAVARYPENDAALLSKYLIARAYHNGAESLTRRLREPSAENEAQINRSRRRISEDLESAYKTYVDVQQQITLAGNAENDPMTAMLLRNCYMMQGSVLAELRRFNEARQAYQNVITLYQSDPVVMEGFMQVANCWRRLNQPELARGNLERAKDVLAKLPEDADFLASTNFTRLQWGLLLDEMIQW